MTSHSISEGFAKGAAVATLGKLNSIVESVGDIRIVLLEIYIPFLPLLFRNFEPSTVTNQKETEQDDRKWNIHLEKEKCTLLLPK
jgi:hypothetical protein